MAAFQQGSIHLKNKSTTQSNADVGWQRLYASTDGNLYIKDENGLTTRVVRNTDVSVKKTIILRTMVDTGTIPTGSKKIFIQSSVAGTITRWRMISDVATIATLDVWKANNAIPTVLNTIIPSGTKPNLSSATNATSTTLTGWTTSVAIGDIFELNVDANSASAILNLELEMDVT